MTTEAPTNDNRPEHKVDEATALAEFERFMKMLDKNIDEKGMDDEDRKGLRECRRLFVRAMQRGSLVLNTKGMPTYTPVFDENSQEPCVFSMPTGDTLLVTDQKKTGHDVAKTHAVLAQMTHRPPNDYKRMDYRDLEYVTAIMSLFLG